MQEEDKSADRGGKGLVATKDTLIESRANIEKQGERANRPTERGNKGTKKRLPHTSLYDTRESLARAIGLVGKT